MSKEFSCWKYEEKNGQVVILEYLGEEERVEIPEVLDEMAVTEVGKYAFYGKQVTEVRFPKTVTSIGCHGFYECRKLKKIAISDYLIDIGDGAFKNCRQLSELEIFIEQKRYSCLKNLLSEMNQQVLCKLYEKDQEIELVFPAYTHNYQENTMARIINQETYGAGAHYREAITKEKILYKEYDSRFYLAENVDQAEALYAIALARLQYPVELLENAKERYKKFIESHWISCIQWLLKMEEYNKIKWLCQYEEMGKELIKQLLDTLQNADQIEVLSEMMEVYQKRFGRERKTFSL